MYYKPRTNNTKQAIKNHSTQVFEQIPIYGEKKVHQQLLEDGFKVSLNSQPLKTTQKLIYNNKTNNNHRQINQLLLKYLLFLSRFA
ncbi:hypothetical protein BSPWISOXPB_6967 [uncultured Gammaproteobacteria bacterium]|nr:hypothetical protein BSPWISOXPB_6967 [uncultured Gammaproteobacteria bacterium]